MNSGDARFSSRFFQFFSGGRGTVNTCSADGVFLEVGIAGMSPGSEEQWSC